MKAPLSDDEKRAIDQWLEAFQNVKFDFDFAHEFQKHRPINSKSDDRFKDTIYNLLAHKSNVLEYNDPPANTRMTFTRKGLDVLEANGYENWEAEFVAQKEFQRLAPKLQKDLTKSTVLTNTLTRRNMIIVGVFVFFSTLFAGGQFWYSKLQFEKDSRQNLEINLILSKIEKIENAIDSMQSNSNKNEIKQVSPPVDSIISKLQN